MATATTGDRTMVAVDQYGPSARSAWMDIDWSRHLRWVQVEGRWMNVVDIGPTDPAEADRASGNSQVGAAAGTIVWIHGLSGSWQNWLENLPAFARTHRCVAMDLPGFGESEMPAEPISISGYARAVDTLLRALGVERASIVGNSMGGFVGAEIAITYSTWVDRLVLVSAAGLSTGDPASARLVPIVRATKTVAAVWAGWLATRSEALVRRPRSRRAILKIVAPHGERLPAPLIAEQLRGSGKPGFADAFAAIVEYPLRERLQQITAPALVVWGEDDPLVPVRDAWAFGELIPDARVVVYEDTGHVAMLERPEAFNALVADFVAS
jgi:pimeloyl-ACP methyl ester carboxylesterase